MAKIEVACFFLGHGVQFWNTTKQTSEHSGCIQNTESDFPWPSRTFYMRFSRTFPECL